LDVMKTVVILLSFVVNTNGIVHKAEYETTFETCYEAERAALTKAWADYVETGKADEISIESCVQTTNSSGNQVSPLNLN